MILEPALVGFGTEGSDLYEADPEQAARLLRRLEARRQIQANFDPGGTDPANRYKRLNQKALENLRTLGYLR